MFINHTHKFIFIHIPKNAGTSIRGSFKTEGYDQRVVNKQYPHDPCSKIRKYCGEEVWNTFFKFAIVRNPYDMLARVYPTVSNIRIGGFNWNIIHKNFDLFNLVFFIVFIVFYFYNK